MNQPNQTRHYPGKVDTVSTVMKIHSVQANRSMVVDRFGLRSVIGSKILTRIQGLDCV